MLRLPQQQQSPSPSPSLIPTTKRPASASSSRGGGGGWGRGRGPSSSPASLRAAARWLVAAWVVAATARRGLGVGRRSAPPTSPPPLLAVIGVLSPPGHFAQRALIRQTYARDPPEGIAVRFVVADVDVAEASDAAGAGAGADANAAAGANDAHANAANAAISRDATLGPGDLWRQPDGNLLRALAREARDFGDLAWRLPTLRGVPDDRAHMARKTLGWFQAVGSGAWRLDELGGAAGGGGAGDASGAAPAEAPLFVLKTDDDVVLHLPNLKRRLLRILDEGRLLGDDEDVGEREEEQEGEEEEGARAKAGAEEDEAAARKPKRRNKQWAAVALGDDPWIYFGRPISSPIFPKGSVYMQGSLYGFSRALARAVAAATPPAAQVEAAMAGGGGGGGGRGGGEAAAAAEDDPAPLDGHEDYLASQWVLRAVRAADSSKGNNEGAVGGRLPKRRPKGARAPVRPAPAVLWANASRAEVHDTPLIASEFSLRLIAPRRVLSVHNAKHPLEFMHAYGGTVGEDS